MMSVLFVRVLCASAVRVGVCGGSVCLGALRFRQRVLFASAVRGGVCGVCVCFGALRFKKIKMRAIQRSASQQSPVADSATDP